MGDCRFHSHFRALVLPPGHPGHTRRVGLPPRAQTSAFCSWRASLAMAGQLMGSVTWRMSAVMRVSTVVWVALCIPSSATSGVAEDVRARCACDPSARSLSLSTRITIARALLLSVIRTAGYRQELFDVGFESTPTLANECSESAVLARTMLCNSQWSRSVSATSPDPFTVASLGFMLCATFGGPLACPPPPPPS